MQISHLALV